MKYEALNIAHYIITKCFNDGAPISNLRLQKMLYFIQGESYKKRGDSLFDNDIRAWKFGPVVPDVYYEYSIYGGMEILESYNDHMIDPEDKKLIDSILKKYEKIETWRLVDMTHAKGTPWDSVYNNGKESDLIPKRLLLEYFKSAAAPC